MQRKKRKVLLCVMPMIGISFLHLPAVEQTATHTIAVPPISQQQSFAAQIPRIASLLASASYLLWQWWHKPANTPESTLAPMPVQTNQTQVPVNMQSTDAQESTSYARQLHAYKRALRKRLMSEAVQLRSLIAEHKPFDQVRLAMPADIYAVRVDAVRTHLIDMGAIEKQMYSTTPAVGIVAERYALPFTCYVCCIGAPLQQTIHMECITLMEHCAMHVPDVMQETVVRCVDAARAYNQAGFCDRAVTLCNLCWALLRSVALVGIKTAGAVGVGVMHGIAQEMGDAAQMLVDPNAWINRLLLLLEIAIACVTRIVQQEPLIPAIAKETVMSEGELIAWHTLIAAVEKQMAQAVQSYGNDQPIAELTLVPENVVKKNALDTITRMMRASAHHMYEHPAYAYLEPGATITALAPQIKCPLCLLSVIAIEVINRSFASA
ncbi:MAG: hypothetical protein WCE21_04080 [Candidatus Babeliales bacterium]